MGRDRASRGGRGAGRGTRANGGRAPGGAGRAARAVRGVPGAVPVAAPREALRRVREEVETDVSARDELRSTSTPTFSRGRCGAWCAQTHYPTTEWWST